ncbi:cytochrome b [Legionella sp. W05-934-2]|uniref:cytochrome b n=1 Tax=Legionella sp. W05-934-2 TaxID=1198649 RepID=UPI003461AFC3
MPLNNNSLEKYSKGSRFFHWLIAVIVITLLAVGFILGDLPDSMKPISYTLHKSFGITVIFLMLIRLLWLIHTGKPKLPASVPSWQRLLSRSVQHGFYVLLFIMPIAGWIMSTAANKSPMFFGLFAFPFPGIDQNKQLAEFMFEVHSWVAWLIIVLLVMHVAGAIKHHFIDKDNVLKRML